MKVDEINNRVRNRLLSRGYDRVWDTVWFWVDNRVRLTVWNRVGATVRRRVEEIENGTHRTIERRINDDEK